MNRGIPHALPYALYVGLGALPPSWLDPWNDAVRIALAGGAVLWFWHSGRYGEMSRAPSWRQTAVAIAVGAAIGAAWVPLAKAVPPMLFSDGARGHLDPLRAGGLEIAWRVAAMVLVVPFVEELFVRSALPRYVESKDEDWRKRPVGLFTPASAAVSIGFFTLSHPEWLSALVTGAAWTLLLARTRNLLVLVISHAVANAWLAAYVITTGESQWW